MGVLSFGAEGFRICFPRRIWHTGPPARTAREGDGCAAAAAAAAGRAVPDVAGMPASAEGAYAAALAASDATSTLLSWFMDAAIAQSLSGEQHTSRRRKSPFSLL